MQQHEVLTNEGIPAPASTSAGELLLTGVAPRIWRRVKARLTPQPYPAAPTATLIPAPVEAAPVEAAIVEQPAQAAPRQVEDPERISKDEVRYALLLQRLEAASVSLATLLARGPADRRAQDARFEHLRDELTEALSAKAAASDVDRLRDELQAFVRATLEAQEQDRRRAAAGIEAEAARAFDRIDNRIATLDEHVQLDRQQQAAALTHVDRNVASLREQGALLDERLALVHGDLSAQIREDRVGALLENLRTDLRTDLGQDLREGVDGLRQRIGTAQSDAETRSAQDAAALRQALEARLQTVETSLQERMAEFLALTSELKQVQGESLDRLGGVARTLDVLADGEAKIALQRLELRANEIVDAVTQSRATISQTLNTMADSARRHAEVAMLALKRGVIPFGDDLVAVRAISAYLVAPGNDPVVPSLYEAGELEPQTTRILAKASPRDGLFVDIGASYGLTVTPVAQAMPLGRIIAFEPTPRTAECLRATLQLNGLKERVEVREMALSSQSGFADLSIGASSTWNSLYPLPSASGAVRVTVSTLDEQLPAGTRVDVLKIDVEGAELDVLQGARRVLSENPDAAIVVEYGLSHLKRAGVSPRAWFEAFHIEGWTETFVIDENQPRPVRLPADGEIGHLSSVNILFLRPGSPAFNRLELQ